MRCGCNLFDLLHILFEATDDTYHRSYPILQGLIRLGVNQDPTVELRHGIKKTVGLDVRTPDVLQVNHNVSYSLIIKATRSE
ncbi:hypothetical protein HOU26_gp39 [Escherichia phage IMM-002]|uniref:Uncharacterized protein n=1 Tax=Escherichia phage IMM-002 TaxID=2041760 RepID=A0A384WIK9_9CAUD|nr:hypothetical protein HOU26_gp39 [Escherichia phage IMM-002]ATI16998.1 hypothetical protein [Escherichia phage IMM-002]